MLLISPFFRNQGSREGDRGEYCSRDHSRHSHRNFREIFMKPNPPSELANYRYDQKSSQTPLPARILGWFALFVFAIAVYSTFFLSGEQMIMMCYVSYGSFIVLFSAYVIVKIVTRHSRCSQCRQSMDIIDVKWTPEQWIRLVLFQGSCFLWKR